MMDDDDDFFGGGVGGSGEMSMSMNMHVTLLRVGQKPDPTLGVALYIDPEVTLQTFLKKAAERLNVNEARQVLNVDGDVVDDFVLVNNREALYIVTDEDESPGTSKETGRLDESGDGCDVADNGMMGGGCAGGVGKGGSGADGSGERVGSYILGKFLGSGSFGKVHIGTHVMTHELVALKFLSKNQMGSTQDAERVFTEIQCLNSLDHPNVIKLLHVIQTTDDMVLALEFASGGDLKEVVEEGPLEEDLASRIFVQILDGVTYCHRHHIIHYDLKLENILLAEAHDPQLTLHGALRDAPDSADSAVAPADSSIAKEKTDAERSEERADDEEEVAPNSPTNAEARPGTPSSASERAAARAERRERLLGLQVKITDFGLSQLCNPGQTSDYAAGSLAYIAPEVFSAGETAGPPRDVWALGVILFTMVCGRLPFSGSTFQEVSEKIKRGTYSWGNSTDTPVSESFKQLIAGMLNTNPEERMTVSEVRLMSWIDRGLPHTRSEVPQQPVPEPEPTETVSVSVKTARSFNIGSDDEFAPTSPKSREHSGARPPSSSSPVSASRSAHSGRPRDRASGGSPASSPPSSPKMSRNARHGSGGSAESAPEPRGAHQSHRRLLSSGGQQNESTLPGVRPLSSHSSGRGSGKRQHTMQILDRRPSTSGSARSGGSAGGLPPLARKGTGASSYNASSKS